MRYNLLALGLIGAISGTAAAQMVSNPSMVSKKGTKHIGGGFSMSKIEYDTDNTGEVEIDRRLITGELSSGLTGKLDFFGQLGIITSSEASFDIRTQNGGSQNVNVENGKGFMFGAGVRGKFMESKDGFVTGYGLFNMTTETIEDKIGRDDRKTKWEVDMTDIHIGGVYNMNYAPDVKPYAGMEILFASDGKVKSKREGVTGKEDMERDNSMTIRFGANIDMDSTVVRPEIILLGERTLSIAAAVLF